ncbi:hypothetical protein FVQ98_14175 [Ottowia sp. GY511]|uniref:hypothetical protein n=1 Tax=Ottowia sp. GY511 TaxID=2603274 RepID=UPI0011D79748|nr:hypothetical protein [Ottowia sp. GY511]TXK26519.1 hypothetical protein FVQ98_14175 [Ottowia sp. GY511]
MHTQVSRLAKLLARKRGTTAYEIMIVCKTVCPHKRMSDLKARGWTIVKKPITGTRFHRYFGQAPKRGC